MKKLLFSISRSLAPEFEFPEPTGININMMPFVLSESFDNSGLPDYLEPYWHLVEICMLREAFRKHSRFHRRSEIDKICYITVQESLVEAGQSQRRPGLHVDCPGYIKIKDKQSGNEVKDEGADSPKEPVNPAGSTGNFDNNSSQKKGTGWSLRYQSHHWGLGGCYVVPTQRHLKFDKEAFMSRCFVLNGGIYMASNVDDSCRVWNCKIVPEEEDEATEGE